MLLPGYARCYLPASIVTRPLDGNAPALDLVFAYHKANKSPIVKALLSGLGKFTSVQPTA
jgi:LysR family transcriptional regulator, hca operon transcriptional activator